MRSFVAIELPAELRGEIQRRVEAVRPDLPPARWIPAENYHLTLVFLGRISPSRVAALAARLGVVFRRSTAFDLRLESGGCFPPRRAARVAWIGVTPAPALLELRRNVARACREEVTLAPERRSYAPHLTVARCRQPWPAPSSRRWREAFSGALGRPFQVREGVLMESRLGPGGATYYPRARLPLAEER